MQGAADQAAGTVGRAPGGCFAGRPGVRASGLPGPRAPGRGRALGLQSPAGSAAEPDPWDRD